MYKKKRERERERANRNNPRTLQMTTLVCVHFRSGKREREDERRENRRGGGCSGEMVDVDGTG